MNVLLASSAFVVWHISWIYQFRISSKTFYQFFYEPLISFISFLRRQSTLINSMGSKFPTICSTRCHYLGNAVNWLISCRVQVVDYIQLKQHLSIPSLNWWILAESAKACMQNVDICFVAIQGRKTLISEQISIVNSLLASISQSIGITCPLN